MMSDRPSDVPDEIAYEPIADIGWTAKAEAMFASGALQARGFITDGVASAHVWGACPRCGHPLDVRDTLSAQLEVSSRGQGLWERVAAVVGVGAEVPVPASADRVVVEVYCGCDRPHTGSADGITGCGVAFRLSVPAESSESSTP